MAAGPCRPRPSPTPTKHTASYGKRSRAYERNEVRPFRPWSLPIDNPPNRAYLSSRPPQIPSYPPTLAPTKSPSSMSSKAALTVGFEEKTLRSNLKPSRARFEACGENWVYKAKEDQRRRGSFLEISEVEVPEFDDSSFRV